jgi:putative transposase
MVRAGVVNHPGQWKESGFSEIQRPPKRYAVIDLQSLSELSGFADLTDFQRAHRQWVEQGLEHGLAVRDDRWSEAIAVGSLAFVEAIKNDLGIKATHREVIQTDGSYTLREPSELYVRGFAGKNEALRLENTFFWDETVDNAGT